MAGRPCTGEARDLTDHLPIDPIQLTPAKDTIRFEMYRRSAYPELICTEFFNTHACSQQLNEKDLSGKATKGAGAFSHLVVR
jgi:hypothetical protein